MPQTAVALREKLHHFIDKVEKKKLKAMYTILEVEIEQESLEGYNKELRSLLDRRYAAYKKSGVVITEKEAQKRISKLLGAIKK